MPEGIGQVAAFDVRSNYGPSNGRALSDWTLLGSEDGVTWDEVARYDYDADTMPQSNRWFSDGSDDKDVARPGKGYSTLVTSEGDPLAGFSSVAVASNATLKAVGFVQLPRLTLDCAAGAGALEGFDIPASGRLDVLNCPSGTVVLPGAFIGCSNLGNVKRWDLFINGERPRNRAVAVRGDRLSIVPTGTLLIVR
jgi:hypothetical protein